MPSPIEQLRALGQSVWLDFIRRGHLKSGAFDQMLQQGVSGVTSNPTIFQQAVTQSDDYDGDLGAGVARGLSASALFDALAIQDIQMACDRLKPTFERTQGVDGRVSIEVNPHFAEDTEKTVSEARRYVREVARPNLMVKIPATKEGLPAIRTALAEGICINVTLIFSLTRYEEVMDAYLSGLERRVAAGQPIDWVFSVASFFVSRVDSKVDPVIEKAAGNFPAGHEHKKTLESFRGQAAIANARLAYVRFREVFGGSRFATLTKKGARVQRPLWASTSTKNPSYPDTLYVDELIGSDTVNTMPPQTFEAFLDHGTPAKTIDRDLDRARALFDQLPALGVPVDRLIAELEPEGVAAFAKSYDGLIAAIESRRAKISAAGGR